MATSSGHDGRRPEVEAGFRRADAEVGIGVGPSAEPAGLGGRGVEDLAAAVSAEPVRSLALTSHDATRMPRWWPRAVWYAIGAFAVAWGMWYVASQLTDLMVTVAICFFLAFAIEPTVNRLHDRHGMSRGRATMLVYVVGLTTIIVLAALFGRLFVDQVVQLVEALPDLYNRVSDMVQQQFGWQLPETGDLLSSFLGAQGTAIAGSVLGILTSLLGIVFGSLTVLLVTFYLVADGPRFRRSVLSFFPRRRQQELLALWEIAIDKTSSYIVSRATLALICGTATFIFLAIIQVPYSLALGAFTGLVAQFVPTVGTYIAGVVPVVVAFGQSVGQGVATLIFILAYQQVENLTIEPQIGARAMELNPAVSFLSVLAGAAVLGPLGAVLALPFAATVKAFVGTYIHRNELIDDELLELDDEQRASRWRHWSPFGRKDADETTKEPATER